SEILTVLRNLRALGISLPPRALHYPCRSITRQRSIVDHWLAQACAACSSCFVILSAAKSRHARQAQSKHPYLLRNGPGTRRLVPLSPAFFTPCVVAKPMSRKPCSCSKPVSSHSPTMSPRELMPSPRVNAEPG